MIDEAAMRRGWLIDFYFRQQCLYMDGKPSVWGRPVKKRLENEERSATDEEEDLPFCDKSE